MNNFIYAIKDLKAGSFISLFVNKKDALVVRDLTNLLKQDNIYAKCPEDFQLFKLGAYNELTGEIVSNIELICDFCALVDSK